MAKRITGVGRLRHGPRRSRIKIGYRPILFFLVTALLIGAYAIAVNIDLEDRINAYNAALWNPSNPP